MMTNEIIKYEQQFEEIRGIITMHREKALRDVNEESLQMFVERLQNLSLPDFVQIQTAKMNKDIIVQTASAQLNRNLWKNSVHF